MYRIVITYDTGDSFHREDGVQASLELKFKNLDKAKQAIKDIEEHYELYYICNKEWNADKKDKDKAMKIARKKAWYAGDEYSFYNIKLENDDGNRVNEHCFWTGYFESLVGADIESDPEDGLSFRRKGNITRFDEYEEENEEQ